METGQVQWVTQEGFVQLGCRSEPVRYCDFPSVCLVKKGEEREEKEKKLKAEVEENLRETEQRREKRDATEFIKTRTFQSEETKNIKGPEDQIENSISSN